MGHDDEEKNFRWRFYVPAELASLSHCRPSDDYKHYQYTGSRGVRPSELIKYLFVITSFTLVILTWSIHLFFSNLLSFNYLPIYMGYIKCIASQIAHIFLTSLISQDLYLFFTLHTDLTRRVRPPSPSTPPSPQHMITDQSCGILTHHISSPKQFTHCTCSFLPWSIYLFLHLQLHSSYIILTHLLFTMRPTWPHHLGRLLSMRLLHHLLPHFCSTRAQHYAPVTPNMTLPSRNAPSIKPQNTHGDIT